MSYAPAGSTTQTAALLHLATVKYERQNLDRLMAQFRFAQVCDDHPLPLNSGKTLQMKRYTLPGQNVSPSAEGVIGSPVPQASSTVSATVEQYSDFMSASTFLVDTDISDTRDAMSDDLSYRAVNSVDSIIRTEIDAQTSAQVATQGSALSAWDFKANVALLKGINVKPRNGSEFYGIIHPYVYFDLIADNTAGGFIDALKYSNGNAVLQGEVGMVGNVRLTESTNVGTTGSSPNVQYYSYIFGAHGIGIVDLAGRGPDRVIDPSNQRFTLKVVQGGPSPSDPVGEIAAYVSYRFAFAAKTLDSTNIRWKSVKADASLV